MPQSEEAADHPEASAPPPEPMVVEAPEERVATPPRAPTPPLAITPPCEPTPPRVPTPLREPTLARVVTSRVRPRLPRNQRQRRAMSHKALANLPGELLRLCLVPVAYLHLKYVKVPVYSANPWIDSFAHTVYDVISQQSINLLHR